MFTVAQRLMDDARTASKFEGTMAPPSLPTTPQAEPSLPSSVARTRSALRAAEEAVRAARLAAGGAVPTQPSASEAIQVEQEGASQDGRGAGPEAPPLPDTPENRAAVIAKLQALQKEWIAAKWVPGQPLPAGMAHPLDIFRGEMHLLPPALAQHLQSLAR